MDDFLADDPGFVSELEKLDLESAGPGPGEFGHRRTLAEWAEEEGLVLSPPDETPFREAEPAAPRGTLTATAFFALMFVGAAAAAGVFHDRVALILASL